MNRTEFGEPRSVCACRDCSIPCSFIPGYLIPADLERMIPAGADPFAWAEANLLASPGALVRAFGETVRIPTLVPRVKADSHECINLQADGSCGIHAVAPFGCAMFDSHDNTDLVRKKRFDRLAMAGLTEIAMCDVDNSLYARLWLHLCDKGLRAEPASVKRARMAGAQQ